MTVTFYEGESVFNVLLCTCNQNGIHIEFENMPIYNSAYIVFSGPLFRKGWLRRTRGSLCVFGAVTAIVIYGGIMNPSSALMWAQELNWKMLMAYYVSGFLMDCVYAMGTALFLWVGAEPIPEKLNRIKVKYGLVE